MQSKGHTERSMLPEFVRATEKLNEVVTSLSNRLADVASSTEAERLATESRERAQRFIHYKPSIVVVGRFKSGKSTIVNEMLNANGRDKQQYSAVDAMPVTRLTIRYEFSSETYAKVLASSGEGREISGDA